jgi:DNA-dependent RNA polymerase auxiliary subunit epsilon
MTTLLPYLTCRFWSEPDVETLAPTSSASTAAQVRKLAVGRKSFSIEYITNLDLSSFHYETKQGLRWELLFGALGTNSTITTLNFSRSSLHSVGSAFELLATNTTITRLLLAGADVVVDFLTHRQQFRRGSKLFGPFLGCISGSH